MNPYVDLLGWAIVALCVIGLCVEVYFLARWIRAEARFKKKSLAEVYFENNVEVDGTGTGVRHGVQALRLHDELQAVAPMSELWKQPSARGV